MTMQCIDHMAVCVVWPACIYVRIIYIYMYMNDHIFNSDFRKTRLYLPFEDPTTVLNGGVAVVFHKLLISS